MTQARQRSRKRAAAIGGTADGEAQLTAASPTAQTTGTTAVAAPHPPSKTAPAPKLARPTKASLLHGMLAAPKGATLAALTQATGWQSHTVRAALTRLRQAGHPIERGKDDEGQTVYRIKVDQGPDAQPTPGLADAANPAVLAPTPQDGAGA